MPQNKIFVMAPMVYVNSVPRSLEFYTKLGFAARNTHQPEGVPEVVWAWLQCNAAQFMVAKASDPVDPKVQASSG